MISLDGPGVAQIKAGGVEYQGNVSGLRPHGVGRLNTAERVYTGEFCNGRRHGYGKEVYREQAR